MAAEKNSQLQGERGSAANLIAGGGYRLTPDLAVELNFLAAGRKLDTPPTATPAGTFTPGTLKSNIGTGGIGATVKYSFAVQRFAPYFGGGVGAYTTTFQNDERGARVRAELQRHGSESRRKVP